MNINTLDPSQKNTLRAITDAKSSDSLFLVHGPPGTGKSQLVVSLLFELALQGKKVLFVSQNTEALDVIDRMITRSEKDMQYPGASNELSFRDFCLKLFKSEQRYLKYSRGQYSRLLDKILPTVPNFGDGIQSRYPLSYVKLNHDQNYAPSTYEIGFDETLQYFLKHVQQPLNIEAMRDFAGIDVRKVLELIDAYPYKDSFSRMVHAQNELRHISTKRSDITLNEVQSGVMDLKDALKGIELDAFKARQPILIGDLLKTIDDYDAVSQYFDVYRLINDAVSLVDLSADLAKSLSASKKLVRSDELVDGIGTDSVAIRATKEIITALTDSTSDVTAGLEQLQEYVKTILKSSSDLGLVKYSDYVVLLAKELMTHVEDVLDKYPELKTFTAEDIEKLITEAAAFHALPALKKKMFAKLPDIISVKLGIEDKKMVDELVADTPKLRLLQSSVAGTAYTVATTDALSKKTIKSNLRALISVSHVPPHDLAEQLAVCYKLRGEGTKFSLTTGMQFQEIRLHIEDLKKYRDTYTVAKRSNPQKIITMSSEQFVAAINKTIGHFRAEADVVAAYQHWRSFLANSPSLEEYLAQLPEFIRVLKANDAESLRQLSGKIAIPIERPALPTQDLRDRFVAQIQDLRKKEIYSPEFFTVNEHQNISDWLSSISSLEYYNNVEQFDAFLTHNKFVMELEQYLGKNADWIRQTLFMDEDLNFESFAQRVINTVVQLHFSNSPASYRSPVRSNYFDEFSKNLAAERRAFYINGLQTMKRRTLPTAQFLSNNNNWENGMSTMDKLRNNTLSLAAAFPVVIATPKDVSKYIAAEKGLFDYVVFDEASQLLPGQALPAIFRAKKAVVIGDQHQMPPTLNAAFSMLQNDTGEDFDEDPGKSILDLARDHPEQQFHLKVHYRSESNKLFQPSREAIYRHDGIEPIWEAQLSGNAPIAIEENLGNEFDELGYDKNFAKICFSVKAYLDDDPGADFCILFTTLDTQKKFRDYLVETEEVNRFLTKLEDEGKLLISTVTNCQGIEGAYSILYLQHYEYPGRMWFFKESAGGYKRLNVAITRQKRGLKLMLADSRAKWLQACEAKISNTSTEPNTLKSAELLRSLLMNAGELVDTTYLDKTLGNNVMQFDSPLTEQLYNKLTDHYKDEIGESLKVYCEVGWHLVIPDTENMEKNDLNIGFRIDIGVYSMKNQKFILGIEMDGAAYHSGYDKEHSDYVRQKVLEQKGWELYRVWSTNWLHNTDTEFKKLTDRIDSLLSEQP